MRIQIFIAFIGISLFFACTWESDLALSSATDNSTVEVQDSWLGNTHAGISLFNVEQRLCALEFILRSATVELPALIEQAPTEDLERLETPPAEPKQACATHVSGQDDT